MRSTRRWKSRLPERRRWCRPWNACANWCRPPRRVRPNWPLPPIRCRRCRRACWIRWTVLGCAPTTAQALGRTTGRAIKRTTERTTQPMTARRGTGTRAGPRGLDLVEGIPFMSRETHIVGFQVGRETYGVPIASLHEIVRVPEITAVPDAPDNLEGVINLRGKIVSVVDLRKRFGQPSAGIDRRSRVVEVEHQR